MGLLDKRLKKAKLLALLLQAIPFVRMIGLTGSLAQGKCHKDSDIDFFIVTKAGRIWTCRFLTVLVLKIIGQYRSEKNSSGKICPNRWQTEDSLEIFPHNFYHAHDYSQMLLLFDQGESYQKFIAANQWFNNFVSADLKFQTMPLLRKQPLLSLFRRIGERLLERTVGDWLEERLREYQRKRIFWDKRSYQKKARIIVSDTRLCFHPEGR